MKVLASTALSFTMFMAMGFQATRPRQASPARPKVEQYDPTKLSPGEVACGREDPRSPDRCQCIKHRMAASEKAQLECHKVEDKKERIKCFLSNEVCSIVPTDVDSAGYDDNGERMPSQCKRSCTKARCECCKS